MGPKGAEYIENEIAQSHSTDLDATSHGKSSVKPLNSYYAAIAVFVAEIIRKKLSGALVTT